MRGKVTTRDGFNEMRERREISLKVSGCNDETKEAGGPSRCQPTHRSCPLLQAGQGRVLSCGLVRTSGRYLLSLFICSDDKQRSNSKDETPRRVPTLLETASTCLAY